MQIVSQCLNASRSPRVLARDRFFSVKGMFLDHISKILYFVDGSRKTIELLGVAPKGNDANGVKHMPLRNTISTKEDLGGEEQAQGFRGASHLGDFLP